MVYIMSILLASVLSALSTVSDMEHWWGEETQDTWELDYGTSLW